MRKNLIYVAYSFEHGDKSLPHLKEMVSNVEDLEKSKIIAYLQTNMIYGCPGIVRDEIAGGDAIIGSGHGYSDGVYVWNDVFCNYVDKYNIPVPEGFRNHILQNFTERQKKHITLRLVDCIEVHNEPSPGYIYNIRIYKNGVIEYTDANECKDGAMMYIKPDDAAYIIDPITTELFCYDTSNHGKIYVDGYFWSITFYRKDTIVAKVDGRPDEDVWRYEEIKRIIEFIERYIPRTMGAEQMNWYTEKTH